MVGRGDLMNTVENALNLQAIQAAVDLGERVQQQVLVETGLLLLTLLLGVLFAWLVARSMARSLRDLRQGALAVAQYGLPSAVDRLRDPALSTNMDPAIVAERIAEPLPVRSKDEFGQVTQAFNAVHLAAVRTAAEQAVLRASVATMFVNLARRSQILVDRLIGHLDRLERGEQDPDRLSELFQLDHLATRMRRNDENLLVLAGADSTRVQREPAALMDVLRAAQSEVEHYTRLQFGVIDQDIEIAAHAVNDLVHLVAELFDNATAFSAPSTAIIVEARRMGDRAVLQVEDRGIGMSPDQYNELNQRLSEPPMVDVAVSRMMGLVVVARLATRHGVRVELRPAPERGTIAEVMMPGTVLVPRALVGRSQMPAGFPATRPPVVPPQRSMFPAPLALESGSAGLAGSSLWGDPPAAPPHSLPTMPPRPGSPVGAPPLGAGGFGGPPTAFAGPPAVPSSGGPAGSGFGAYPPPPGGPANGLGAALSGESGPYGVNGGTGGGRSLPAWADLTGAPGVGPPGPAAPADAGDNDPLPQRRPGTQWGDADDPPPYDAPRPGDHGPSAFAGGPPPFGPPGGFPTGGMPPGGMPPAPAPLPSPYPPAPSASSYPPAPSGSPYPPSPSASPYPPPPAAPNLPTMPGAGPPGPMPAAHPPAWPPVAPDPGPPPEAVPALPENFSAALDMTSELPRVRSDVPAPSRYAEDLTMELPIFRELESAWFRGGATSPMQAVPAGDEWPAANTPPPPAGAGMADTTAGGASAGAGTERVSWRSAADDGWRAAQAASDPEVVGTTETGLPKRVPMAQLVPGGVEQAGAGAERRSPDAVRGLLSAYHSGVERGRGAQGKAAEPSTAGSQTNGKEHEA
jgi:signal transduction histidine kinase